MQLICPACGTSVEFAEDSEATRAVCTGCGKRLSSRTILAPPAAIDAEQLAVVAEQPKQAILAAVHTAAAPRIHWGAVVAVVIVSNLVVGLACYWIGSSSLNSGQSSSHSLAQNSTLNHSNSNPPFSPATAPTTDDPQRTEILRLQSLASAAAMDGDLRGAYQQYQDLAKIAADKPPTDPVTIQAVSAAQIEQAKVFSLLMDKQPAQPATAPAMAAVSPDHPSALAVPTTSPAVTQPKPAVAAATKPAAPPMAMNPADSLPEIAGVTPGPRPVRTYSNDNGVTDAEIGDAIVKGIVYLKSQFKNGAIQVGRMTIVRPNFPGGNFPGMRTRGPFGLGGFQGGPTNVSGISGAATAEGFDALAAYALLHAGQATDGKFMQQDDPFTRQMLDVLKQIDMPYTYWRSLRASALAVLNRVEDKAVLEDDVNWLTQAHRGGGYTYLSYGDKRTTQGITGWDNSNSQYGLLGVWSGAEAGISVAMNYWNLVATHWTSSQMTDGQWGYTYQDQDPRLSMTLAGTASELVCADYFDQANSNGRGKLTPSETGLNWLDTGDNCMVSSDEQWHGYVLYGLERVGLASGYKYFGKHDWYAEFAKSLVASQHGDGSWGGSDSPSSIMETAYSLLFLARGRHPILYNHIRYDGAWNMHPRAISHLAKFASKTLERPLNWQVVNFARPWYDWMDSPVLYLSGTDAPNLTESDYRQLQAFANGGGLIFTHADEGSAAFNAWVDHLVRKIFRDYEFSNIPKDHPIYSTVFTIKQPPPLKIVTNGSRILLVHSAKDIADGWQSNWTDAQKPAFQMGINLFVYAAGKANFKNRLSSPYLPIYTGTINHTYPVARVQYGGHWNPEPYAWTRFGRHFGFATQDDIAEKQTPLADLTTAIAPLAVLTGTVRNDFTETEAAAARAYVDGGGVLLVDACGGRPEFAKSATALISKAFPDADLSPLPGDHPLLLASRTGADDLRKVILRPYAGENGGHSLPLLGFAHGKGHVILSRLDLTTGLLGTNQWGIMGYDPNYSSALMKNAVLWTAARTLAGR